MKKTCDRFHFGHTVRGGQMVTVSRPEEGPETTDISAVSWKREDQGIQLTDAPRPRQSRGCVQTINKPNYYTIP